ncbi:MAG: response regulator transcription factor [Clostridia bacterium]|nr:response regulator transcription factor [Clostridia bacterium]
MLGTKMLIIDDDLNICEMIKVYFQNEGYDVAVANDGVAGMSMFKSYDPDIILLDLMLPKKDGTDVCREIRAVSNKPMIMITAKGGVFDKVLGLELGADDFVVKPFDMKELLARVKAVLRRYSVMETHLDKDTLRFDNLEISLSNHELKIKGVSVDIPNKEFMLLHFLAKNFNRVFTRDQLLNKVWSFDYLGDSRTVDVHIKRLREKLNGVSSKWELRTIWGVGYKFEVFPQNND